MTATEEEIAQFRRGPFNPAVCPQCDMNVLADMFGKCVHCESQVILKANQGTAELLARAKKRHEDAMEQATRDEAKAWADELERRRQVLPMRARRRVWQSKSNDA